MAPSDLVEEPLTSTNAMAKFWRHWKPNNKEIDNFSQSTQWMLILWEAADHVEISKIARDWISWPTAAHR